MRVDIPSDESEMNPEKDNALTAYRDMEDLAQEYREALAQGEAAEHALFRRRFAPRIATTHNPVQESDGLRDSAEVLNHFERQARATARIFPKGRQVISHAVEVLDEARLRVRSVKRGVMDNGTVIETSSAITYTVEQGRITRRDSDEADGRESLAFVRVLIAAGFEYPAAEEAERRLLARIAAEHGEAVAAQWRIAEEKQV